MTYDGSKLVNVRINGRRTSMKFLLIELEALSEICRVEGVSLHEFCSEAVKTGKPAGANATAKVRERMTRILLNGWRRGREG